MATFLSLGQLPVLGTAPMMSFCSSTTRMETSSGLRPGGGPEREAIHGLALAGDFVYLAGDSDSFSHGQSDALIIKADRCSGHLPPVNRSEP